MSKEVSIGLTLEESYLLRTILSDFLCCLAEKEQDDNVKKLRKRVVKLYQKMENRYGGVIGLQRYKEEE